MVFPLKKEKLFKTKPLKKADEYFEYNTAVDVLTSEEVKSLEDDEAYLDAVRALLNRRESARKKRIWISRLIRVTIFTTIIIASFLYGTKVHAEGEYVDEDGDMVQWLVEYEGYSEAEAQDYVNGLHEIAEKRKISPLEKYTAELFWGIAATLDKLFKDGEIDTDSVVVNKTGNSPFQFTLKEGSSFGVTGAAIYVVFRSICMSLLFVYTAYCIMKMSLGGGAKNRAEVKELFYNVIIALFLIYFFPTLLDWAISVRLNISDTVIGKISSLAGGKGSFSSLGETIMGTRETEDGAYSVPMALTALAYQGATIVFIMEYIGLSTATMILFGLGPIIFVLGIKDRGLLNKWTITLILNCLVPLFDAIIMGSLSLVVSGISSGMAASIVCIIGLWNVLPARRAAISMLGGTNMATASGIAGLGAIAGGLAAGVGNMAKGFSNAREESGGSVSDSLTNAKMENAIASADGVSPGGGKGITNSSALGDLDVNGGINGKDGSSVGISELVQSESSKSGSPVEIDSASITGGVDAQSATSPASSIESAEASSASIGGSEVGYTGSYDVGSFGGGTASDLGGADVGDERLSNLQALDAENAQLSGWEAERSAFTGDVGKVGAEELALASEYGSLAAAQGRLETLDANSAAYKEAEQEKRQHEQTIRDLEKGMDIKNDQYKSLKEITAMNLSAQNGAASAAMMKNQSVLRAQARSEQQRVGQLNKQISQTKQSIAAKQQIERDFASADKARGGTGTRYDNAGQYTKAMALNAAKTRNLSYKTFDTGDNKSGLTPTEKADFYNSRALGTAGRYAVNVGAGVAGAGLRMAAATALSVGGPEAIGVVNSTAGAVNDIKEGALNMSEAVGDVRHSYAVNISPSNAGGNSTVAPKKVSTNKPSNMAPANSGGSNSNSNSRRGGSRFSTTVNNAHDLANSGRSGQT